MSDEWVIRVSEEGDIQTLWHDALDLEDLGHCTVERLTNVEYVEDAWQISYARNNCPMTQQRFAKRADALAAEQRIVFAFWQHGGGSF